MEEEFSAKAALPSLATSRLSYVTLFDINNSHAQVREDPQTYTRRIKDIMRYLYDEVENGSFHMQPSGDGAFIIHPVPEEYQTDPVAFFNNVVLFDAGEIRARLEDFPDGIRIVIGYGEVEELSLTLNSGREQSAGLMGEIIWDVKKQIDVTPRDNGIYLHASAAFLKPVLKNAADARPPQKTCG